MDWTTMPFGKHKGKPVEEVDTAYLLWVMTNCRKLRWELYTSIGRVLNQRGVLQPASWGVTTTRLSDGKVSPRKRIPPRPWPEW